MNSSSSFVVLGEAPESESEEELNVSNADNKLSRTPTKDGSIIAGEAPESDDENAETGSLESVSSALSASSLPSLLGGKRRSSSNKDLKSSSLLNKKLCERNASLHKNVTEYVSQTINNAGKELNSTNQQLLKCQVQLQEAVSSLRTLNVNVSQLETTFSAITTTDFIPFINLESALT